MKKIVLFLVFSFFISTSAVAEALSVTWKGALIPGGNTESGLSCTATTNGVALDRDRTEDPYDVVMSDDGLQVFTANRSNDAGMDSNQLSMNRLETPNEILTDIMRNGSNPTCADMDGANPRDLSGDAIATAARSLASELNSPIIVCYTESGSTGIKVSRVRPKQMILTVTPIIKTARKLTLVWGVKCIVQKDANNLEQMIKMTKTYSKKEKIIKIDEKMVITAGLPLKKLGTTNLIRVVKVD